MTAIPKPSKVRKESRPSRDEFELMELSETIQESFNSKKMMSFLIWRRLDPLKGRIDKLDTNTQRVHIQTTFDGMFKVPFMDILQVKDLEQ